MCKGHLRWIPVIVVTLALHAASQQTKQVREFLPTKANRAPAPGAAPKGMVWVPGGEFSMGVADPRGVPHGGREAMEDARPIHRVYVNGFWMDKTTVTNAEFAKFVEDTGYITVAERKPSAADFPNAAPEDLVPGSIVFQPPSHPVPLDDPARWWSFVPGADWRHPEGPGSSIEGRSEYPVVQVAYEDAVAFANWAGKRLPTEAEWEFAARGGLTGKRYVWGDDVSPHGKWLANTHQGHFPDHNTRADGFSGVAPVASFPPNGYGLYDMAGNVWQWVADWYHAGYYSQVANIVSRNPQGPVSSFDPQEPGVKKRVQRGGSFLCTEQYCTRYILGTRGKGEVSSASNHLGFRCVRSADAAAESKMAASK